MIGLARCTAWCLVALLGATSLPAAAQTAGSTELQKVDGAAPAWTVTCVSVARSAPADCRIEQRLFAREGGQLLSVMAISIPAAGREAVLSVDMPNGISLPDGVFIAVDAGTAMPMVIRSCDAAACHATLALTPPIIAAMQAGQMMTVSATALNREKLSLPHLLTDFTSAYKAAK